MHLQFNENVDIWSLGCIMFELIAKKPLFKAKHNKDLIYKICELINIPLEPDYKKCKKFECYFSRYIDTDIYSYLHNKKLYLDFVDYHKNLIKNLNEKIDKVENEQSVYLFGAGVFAQYLIEFGLNTDHIECLLDNDKDKQGRRLYGTNLMVESPKILADVKSPIVILKAGVYNKEIIVLLCQSCIYNVASS